MGPCRPTPWSPEALYAYPLTPWDRDPKSKINSLTFLGQFVLVCLEQLVANKLSGMTIYKTCKNDPEKLISKCLRGTKQHNLQKKWSTVPICKKQVDKNNQLQNLKKKISVMITCKTVVQEDLKKKKLSATAICKKLSTIFPENSYEKDKCGTRVVYNSLVENILLLAIIKISLVLVFWLL